MKRARSRRYLVALNVRFQDRLIGDLPAELDRDRLSGATAGLRTTWHPGA
jgi:hypothetical protein